MRLIQAFLVGPFPVSFVEGEVYERTGEYFFLDNHHQEISQGLRGEDTITGLLWGPLRRDYTKIHKNFAEYSEKR